MLHVALWHETRYRYDRPVALGPQVIRLRPAPHTRTPVAAYALHVEPPEHSLHWQQDPYGNFLARVVFARQVTSLRIVVDLTVEMRALNPFDFLLEPGAETHPFVYEPGLRGELAPFLQHGAAGPRLAAWLASVDREPVPTLDRLVALNQRLRRDVAYLVRMEPGVQSFEETLAHARGSCRDSAWLLAEILRQLGIAARFASGYLIQLAPEVPDPDDAAQVSEDAASLHAWTEAYLPGAGWVGLDPTSGLLTGEGHIPLACGAKPERAAPVSGSVGEGGVRLEHSMRVTRLAEPRPG